MLLNSGEASNAGRTIQQTQSELLEFLYLLLKKLQAQIQPKGKDQKEQPSAEEQQQTDQCCAIAAKDLLSKHGVQEMTDDGIQHVYRTEGYTITADLNHGTGYPVYTVRCSERGDVLKFQDDPQRSGEYVFYDTQHSLSDQVKFDLLNSLKTSLETRVQQSSQAQAVVADALAHEPGVSATPAMKAFDEKTDRDALLNQQSVDAAARKVKTDLEELGDFAPLGSKAMLVAHQVLGDSNEHQGEKYSVRRTESGSVELFEGGLPKPGNPEPKAPIAALAPDGKISCSPAFSQAHSKAFSAMHRRLGTTAQAPQAAKTASKSSARSAAEVGGR